MSEAENKEGTGDSSDIHKDVEVPGNENSENSSITTQGGESPIPKKNKVDIFLKATANAPIMKRRKWTVDHDKTIGWIISFIKKYLQMEANDSLFLYVNQSFAPSPDQVVRNLYECFGTDGKLILHYCKTQAWG